MPCNNQYAKNKIVFTQNMFRHFTIQIYCVISTFNNTMDTKPCTKLSK